MPFMNSPRKSFVLAAVCSVFLLACGSEDRSSPRSPAANVTDSPCDRSSWVAGSTEYCQGELIYRDYIYDDYGADAGLIAGGPTLLNLTTRLGQRGNPFATTPSLLAPSAGDVTYPAGLANTADLVKLSLSISGNELLAEFELNTLFNANDAIAALAIDTDNNAATGGGAWAPLQVSSRGWDVLKTVAVGDPVSNRLQLRMPVPAGSVWRVQAAVAQANGKVMNVAFRGMDEQAGADGLQGQLLPNKGNYWEDKQAAALASGDISQFGETLRVADLRNGLTKAAPAPVGFHQRVYTSKYVLGEGVELAGVAGRDGDTSGFCSQSFNYLGKYQPYGIYLPKAQAAKPGIQVVMHGCEANHASQINQPGFQQQMGEDRNRILIAPLGRGPYGFYSGVSERDVLDVIADAEATYVTDPERMIASGYSMGGFGAMHLATNYPDRFAGMVNWVGFTGSLRNIPNTNTPLDAVLTTLTDVLKPVLDVVGPINGSVAYENVIHYIGNLRHVPSANLYSGADELVQVNQAIALAQTLDQTGVPYRFYLHPVSEHLTFIALDDWRKESEASADWVRVKNPRRITYRFDPRFDYPEYAVKHDRAYWLSQLVTRDGLEAEVELEANGCGGNEATYTAGQDAGPSPLPWVGLNRVKTGQEPVAAASTLSGSLRNVAAGLIEASAICLGSGTLSYDIISDGTAQLRLSSGKVIRLIAGRNQGAI